MKKRMGILFLLFTLVALVSACGTPNVPSTGSSSISTQTQLETSSSTPENLLIGTWEAVYIKTEVASEGPIEYTKTENSDYSLIINIESDGSWEVKENGTGKRFTWHQDGNNLEVGDNAGAETYEIVELTEKELLLSSTIDDSTLTMRMERR